MNLLTVERPAVHTVGRSWDGESTAIPYVTSGPLADLLEVRTADATLNDLRTAQDDATDVARELGIPVESQIDVIENRVKLFVVDRERLDSSLATPDVELPSKVDVVTVSELSRVTTDLHAGLTLKTCTAGFAVTHSDGRRGITTAGHCTPQTFNGTDLDFVSKLLGGEHDVQWYEAPGFTLRGLIYDGSGNRYVYGTKSRANQTVGSYVCKYGEITGFGCGSIETTDFRPDMQYGCTIPCSFSATFIRVHNKDGDVLAERGDSGGPWFRGNTAYGIMRSQADGDGVYMAINYISDLGISVLTE